MVNLLLKRLLKFRPNLKMHNVLLGTIALLFVLGIGLSIYKSLNKSANEFKSTYQANDVLLKLTETSAERMVEHKLDYINKLDISQVAPVLLMIFKKEKELVLWSETLKQSAKFKIKEISPGVGLKITINDEVFPEGIFDIEDIGLHDEVGYFIKLEYPTGAHLADQKIKQAEFARDAILISEKPYMMSYATLDPDDLEDVVYYVLKIGKENVKILVFPSKPPLEMDLSGSYTLAEILKQLNQKYQQYIQSPNE